MGLGRQLLQEDVCSDSRSQDPDDLAKSLGFTPSFDAEQFAMSLDIHRFVVRHLLYVRLLLDDP